MKADCTQATGVNWHLLCVIEDEPQQEECVKGLYFPSLLLKSIPSLSLFHQFPGTTFPHSCLSSFDCFDCAHACLSSLMCALVSLSFSFLGKQLGKTAWWYYTRGFMQTAALRVWGRWCDRAELWWGNRCRCHADRSSAFLLRLLELAVTDLAEGEKGRVGWKWG